MMLCVNWVCSVCFSYTPRFFIRLFSTWAHRVRVFVKGSIRCCRYYPSVSRLQPGGHVPVVRALSVSAADLLERPVRVLRAG